MADCCSRVISTPLRMVFRGGSESLYRPAILAAVGRSAPLRHQGQGSRGPTLALVQVPTQGPA